MIKIFIVKPDIPFIIYGVLLFIIINLVSWKVSGKIIKWLGNKYG